MWRPEGWVNPYKNTMAGDEWSDFEAGASAILEALKSRGLKVNNIGDIPKGEGVIIFIPDEGGKG